MSKNARTSFQYTASRQLVAALDEATTEQRRDELLNEFMRERQLKIVTRGMLGSECENKR